MVFCDYAKNAVVNNCFNSCTMWRKDLKASLYKHKKYILLVISMWTSNGQCFLLEEVGLSRYFCRGTLCKTLLEYQVQCAVEGLWLPWKTSGWKTITVLHFWDRQARSRMSLFLHHCLNPCSGPSWVSIISLLAMHSIGLYKNIFVSNCKLFLQWLICITLNCCLGFISSYFTLDFSFSFFACCFSAVLISTSLKM